MSEISIYHLIEGAKKAEGLTVIIDVFRAFSLECYLYDMGAAIIRPVGTVEAAFKLRYTIADSLLIGERHGRKCDGFDYGNSPSSIDAKIVSGKSIIHTTSAGTQGVVNAVNATKVITGSLVNAEAVANYIKRTNPKKVSLVCMGNGGVSPAKEDELCADYIKYLVEGGESFDLEKRIEGLKCEGGAHFFDMSKQDVFPKEDFYMCVKHDTFPFVIEIDKDEMGFIAKKVEI